MDYPLPPIDWIGEQVVEKMEHMHKNGSSPNHLKLVFYNYLIRSRDPYMATLQILDSMDDLHMARPNLSTKLLECFKTFLTSYSGYWTSLTMRHRVTAFHVLLEINNENLIKSLIDTYNMSFARSNYDYTAFVQQYVADKRFRILAYVLIQLRCPQLFSIELFIIPLFLKSNYSEINQLCELWPKYYAPQYALFLDHSLAAPSVLEYFSHFSKKYNVKIKEPKKLSSKAVVNIIHRLLTSHQIDPKFYPNTQKRHAHCILGFLFQQRFRDKVINKINFSELIRDLIDKSDTQLQIELIARLHQFGAIQEAIEWLETFQNRDNGNIQTVRRLNYRYNSEESSSDWEPDNRTSANVSYKKLSIAYNKVHFIASPSSFGNILTNLLAADIIGIDAEWKPFSKVYGKEPDLAILQLATDTDVFIIDVIQLKNEQDLWNRLVSILQNCNIIKIGFQMDGDIQRLFATVPNIQSLMISSSDFVDLSKLWPKLVTKCTYYFDIPYERKCSYTGISLSSVIKMFYGCELDKTNQISNWENRPLRKDQLIYAAIDAHCLVEIYRFFESHCPGRIVDLDRITCIPNAKGEDQNKIQATFYKYVQLHNDPYKSALLILQHVYDLEMTRPSLTMLLLNDFKTFLVYHNLHERLTHDVKLMAFHVLAKITNQTLIKSFIQVYDLTRNITYDYSAFVRGYVACQRFCVLAHVLVHLKCPQLFPIDVFIIPLFLESNYGELYELCDAQPKYVPELVQFLDNSLSNYSAINYFFELAERYNVRIKDSKKLSSKAVVKIIHRLLTSHQIDVEYYPNTQKRHTHGILTFILRQRFLDKVINKINFSELIRDLIDKSDTYFQNELIVCLSQYDATQEALEWANLFEIPENRRPHALRHFRPSTSNDEQLPRNVWEPGNRKPAVVSYKKLGIAHNKVHFITSPSSFAKILQTLLAADIIGIDAEWKPFSKVYGKESDLAILQLATDTDVFIIDVIQLKNEQDLWNRLVSILQNFNIIKIGFQMDGDIQRLFATVPNIQSLMISSSDFVDLSKLWPKLVSTYNFVIPYERYHVSSGSSLSSVIKMCFGCELDKTNQFSNWENRPLRKDQLMYAAIDAHCLVETYRFLESHCRGCKVELDTITCKLPKGKKDKQMFVSTVNIEAKAETQPTTSQLPHD